MLIRNLVILSLASYILMDKIAHSWEHGFRSGYQQGFQQGVVTQPQVWKSGT